jgi:hypothetical protein
VGQKGGRRAEGEGKQIESRAKGQGRKMGHTASCPGAKSLQTSKQRHAEEAHRPKAARRKSDGLFLRMHLVAKVRCAITNPTPTRQEPIGDRGVTAQCRRDLCPVCSSTQ